MGWFKGFWRRSGHAVSNVRIWVCTYDISVYKSESRVCVVSPRSSPWSRSSHTFAYNIYKGSKPCEESPHLMIWDVHLETFIFSHSNNKLAQIIRAASFAVNHICWMRISFLRRSNFQL